MQTIGTRIFNEITKVAGETQRKRKNFNIHTVDSAPCQRLLNAVEPESYVSPHCHASADKDETIVALKGRFGVVFFDGAGKVIEKTVITAGGDVMGVNIPHGQFHTMVSLESGSVFFEAKAGPYQPIRPEERAAWAPAEGAQGATEYLDGLRKLF